MKNRPNSRYRHRRQYGMMHSSYGIAQALATVYHRVAKVDPALAAEFKQGVLSLKVGKEVRS